MNLAPNLPDDPTLHRLLQLLHEELGLPERKTISLTTSINFDLGCNGTDAQHLIETLEDHFAIDFVDFDSYRYFQPDGFDVNLKRKAKGRGEKVNVCGYGPESHELVRDSTEKLLADFFGLDLDKMEAEKRKMLAELQA